MTKSTCKRLAEHFRKIGIPDDKNPYKEELEAIKPTEIPVSVQEEEKPKKKRLFRK